MAATTLAARCSFSQATVSLHRKPELKPQFQHQLKATARRPRAISAAMTSDLPVSSSEEASVPTPVLPSGPMMAGFLIAYQRMLEHELESGDSAAAAGQNVLERIRVGLEGLLHHPKHGASKNAGPSWFIEEHQVEACLGELEKDIGMFYRFHDKHPTPLAVKLASVHCSEAARLLQRL